MFLCERMSRLTLFILVLCVISYRDVLSKHHRRHRTKSHKTHKIVGGEPVTIQQFPYMAYLALFDGKGYTQCGGSIISENFILTAGHCTVNKVNVSARVASTYGDRDGTTYDSSKLYTHPDYDPSVYDYDIGLIEFDTPITIDDVSTQIMPLVGSNHPIPANTIINITGWGDLNEDGTDTDTLHFVQVPTLTNEDCAAKVGDNNVTPRIFCAGYEEGGRDHCEGDSGGPAVTSNFEQVGVISSAFGCARPHSPAFYGNVTDPSIRDWITKVSGV